MKKMLTPVFVGLLLSCAAGRLYAQEFTEHISKEFTLSKEAAASTLAIYNFEGFVKVEGYAGNKVVMEIDKTISAKDNENLEIGKKEFRLEFEQKGDSILAYILEPLDSRPHRDWHNRRDWDEIKYRFRLEFTIKVPFAMNLDVSTVNDGNMEIKDVAGNLHVNNVNGSIAIKNAKGTTHAHTVNGAVEVNYLSNPPGQSSYYTVNGQIKVVFPANLSADLQFKSMNGEFYTDFQDAKQLPTEATRTQEKNGGGTVYKINKVTAVRIGAGGSIYKFETLNGNIYIKKQS